MQIIPLVTKKVETSSLKSTAESSERKDDKKDAAIQTNSSNLKDIYSSCKLFQMMLTPWHF